MKFIYFFYYLFLFIACSSIIVLGFSAQYYQNNLSYEKYVKSLPYMYKYDNPDIEQSVIDNNRYNQMLKAIIVTSAISILLSLPMFITLRYHIRKIEKENTIVENNNI